MEFPQVDEQFLFVLAQDVRDRWWLIRIGNKDLSDMSQISERHLGPLWPVLSTDLENVERLELDVLALVPQRIHNYLEVLRTRDIPCHDPVICPV